MEYKSSALFLEPDMREKYKSIVMSWLGTPYKHLWMSKGRGADCTLLPAACLLELGVLTGIEHDTYPRHWYMNTKDEWVIEGFHKHMSDHMAKGYKLAWFQSSDTSESKETGYEADWPELIENFIFGDVLTFTTTKMNVTNHCAIWLDDGKQMFNSIRQQGCSILTYGSFWEKRLTGILRVYRMD